MSVDDPQWGMRLTAAIHSGDVAMVDRLLSQVPHLATGQVHGGRTALHVVTDWPGYFPHGPQIAQRLLNAGADPNALTEGKGAPETPLHWAASTDDVDVAQVLLDAGADPDTPGGSIGTPLANAVGYGCWHVARLLLARGARVDTLWQAAAIGMQERVQELLACESAPDEQAITEAFWQACAGGQRRMAMLLLQRGADINGQPHYAGKSALQAATGPDTRRDLLTEWLRKHGAT
jgi:ankyrin repeat protein